MTKLDLIMEYHLIDYEYKIETNGVILNRDVLNLIDRIDTNVYITYLGQQVPKSGQFFLIMKIVTLAGQIALLED